MRPRESQSRLHHKPVAKSANQSRQHRTDRIHESALFVDVLRGNFDYKTAVYETYLAHGYLDIETPTIERAEILLAKAGNEEMFVFLLSWPQIGIVFSENY